MVPQVEGAVREASHELLDVFAANGLRLNQTLVEMLTEHHSHCTERRGCGYTQATRHLATYVNQPRLDHLYDEVRLFADRDASIPHRLVALAEVAGITLSWRHLDRQPPPDELANVPEFTELYAREAARQARLRRLPGQVTLEESRILAQIIVDLILPLRPGEVELEVLSPWSEKLAIGTCPLAEKYFLELSDRFVRRKGRMNIIVDGASRPLLAEKLNLGDNHSCVSLRELVLNGVRLPPGSLFGVTYEGSPSLRPCRTVEGDIISVSSCSGFRFLRLTTLAVSPQHRARAFTKHFDAQVDGGLFAPGTVTTEALLRVAEEQL